MPKRVMHFQYTLWNGTFAPICKPWPPSPAGKPPDLTLDAQDVTCKHCLQRRPVRLLLAQSWPPVESMSRSFRLVGAEWNEKRILNIRTKPLTPDEARVVTDQLIHMLHPTYLEPEPEMGRDLQPGLAVTLDGVRSLVQQFIKGDEGYVSALVEEPKDATIVVRCFTRPGSRGDELRGDLENYLRERLPAGMLIRVLPNGKPEPRVVTPPQFHPT